MYFGHILHYFTDFREEKNCIRYNYVLLEKLTPKTKDYMALGWILDHFQA